MCCTRNNYKHLFLTVAQPSLLQKFLISDWGLYLSAACDINQKCSPAPFIF